MLKASQDSLKVIVDSCVAITFRFGRGHFKTSNVISAWYTESFPDIEIADILGLTHFHRVIVSTRV